MKIGPIGCPKMSVRNYCSALCNILEECRSRVTIWQYRPCFAPHGPVQSDPVWHGLVGCSICKFKMTLHKFKEKASSFIPVNTSCCSVYPGMVKQVLIIGLSVSSLVPEALIRVYPLPVPYE